MAGLVKSVASKTAKRSPWRQTVHIFSFSFFQRKQSRCQHRPWTQEYWRACCLQKEINIKNVFFSHEALIDHNNFHFYLLFAPRCFNATLWLSTRFHEHHLGESLQNLYFWQIVTTWSLYFSQKLHWLFITANTERYWSLQDGVKLTSFSEDVESSIIKDVTIHRPQTAFS